MTAEHPEQKSLKQKASHEMREFFGIFLFLALFLCTLAAYSTLLLQEFQVRYFAFGAALINALIMSKIILLGEYAGIGHKLDDKPLLFSVIVKAGQYSFLMVVFHVIEEVIKQLFHGHTVNSALRDLASNRLIEILVRNLVVFCALLPFFASREMRRVLGEEKFADLFLRKGASAILPGNDRSSTSN